MKFVEKKPAQELLKLYERWGLLTQAESEAIQARAWGSLLRHQNEKQSLTIEIARLYEAVVVKPTPAGSGEAMTKTLRPILERLISLELENARALATQRQLLAEEQTALHQASRQLHEVHRAYAPGTLALWHSYS